MSMSARLRSRRRTLTTPLGALLALLALGAFAGLAGCRPAVPDTVKIGVAQPLSGPLKAMGQDMLDGARLAIDGKPIVFPPTTSTGFVHPDRLADVCTVQHALVLTLVRNDVVPPTGTELTTVDAAPSLDRAALARLKAQAQSEPIQLGPDLEAALAELPGDEGALVGSSIIFRMANRTDEVLLVGSILDLLIEHPPAAPKLDHDDLVALRASLPSDFDAAVATEVSAHLLDRAELEAYRPDLVSGC